MAILRPDFTRINDRLERVVEVFCGSCPTGGDVCRDSTCPLRKFTSLPKSDKRMRAA